MHEEGPEQPEGQPTESQPAAPAPDDGGEGDGGGGKGFRTTAEIDAANKQDAERLARESEG